MTFNADLDNDGKLSEGETRLLERRLRTQRWFAIICMVINNLIVLGLLALAVTNEITPSAIDALGAFLPLYFVGSWGIVAAYFGVEAWLSKHS